MNTAQQASSTPTGRPDAEIEAARNAASSAAPFAHTLAERCRGIARGLRQGQDQVALETLGDLSEDLEHFLKFLILVSDYFPQDSVAKDAVYAYKTRLLAVVEGIQPALSHMDLVEVADAVQEDLVVALQDYQQLDEQVQEALGRPV